MNYKKLFLGSLSIAALAFGSIAIAKADNNGTQGNNQNTPQLELHDPFPVGTNPQESHDPVQGPKSVGSSLEVHITNNGNVVVKGAKITTISGTTISATTTWGSAAVSWAVNTDANTKMLRRYGGASQIAEMAVGDYISFQGTLVTGTASSMTVLAKTLTDSSIQKKNATFSGTVSSISGTSFVLATSKNGNVTVNTATTTVITKNGGTGAFTDIAVGSTVMATGLYNNLNTTLDATKVNVKVVMPKPMTKEGTIKSIAGTTAPTTFVLTSGGTDYTVNIATSTSILANNWTATLLTNLVVGNNVKVYGIVNPTNTIDATVVRDTNL